MWQQNDIFVLDRDGSIIHCFSAVLSDSSSKGGGGGGLKCCWFFLSGQMKDVALTAVIIAETLAASQAGHLYPDWLEQDLLRHVILMSRRQAGNMTCNRKEVNLNVDP